MHLPHRLCFLPLLVSLPVAAQSMDPWSSDSEPSSTGARPQVPEAAMDLSLPQRSPERLPPPARIGAELGGGVLGLLSGGLVGGGGGFLVALLGCSASLDGGLCDVATLVYGTALGAGAGTSLGVHLGGKAAGGNGTGWAAAGGVTLGLAALLFAAPEGQQQRLLPYALALPVLGVLGYELTDRAPEAGSVTPSLALGPQGGSLALSGRF